MQKNQERLFFLLFDSNYIIDTQAQVTSHTLGNISQRLAYVRQATAIYIKIEMM